MNTSGEVADQVVRMTLSGVEVLLRISGFRCFEADGISLCCFERSEENKRQNKA